uniref:Sphingomyelin synthase-like domain-containing protein n=1 Tax=Panagrolaimus sp. PS1159 TaxID=55785 RepID=A0AC35FSA4_9BILA
MPHISTTAPNPRRVDVKPTTSTRISYDLNMLGHRRGESDSHMPLRQGEVAIPFDSIELSSRVEIPNDAVGGANSSGGTHSCVLAFNGVMNQSTSHFSQQSDNNFPRSVIPPERFRTELLKLAVAFFCLVISAFLNFFLLTVIHDIVPRQPLPDLVFMLIPQQRWAWAVGDVFSTINATIGFIIIFLHKERIIVLRRAFLLGGILYGLRAVVLGVTFLPPSFHNRDEMCLPQVNRSAMYTTEIIHRFVTYVVTLGLTSGQEKILCGDLMFSGHTLTLTIMYFIQLQYTPRGLVVLRYIATPITFCGIAALVVSGGHYTMDVLIAYWLTTHVFWGYHQMFEMPRNQRASAPLSRVWWFWLCYWFEADVPPGPLKNEWDLPIGPIFLRKAVSKLNKKLQ